MSTQPEPVRLAYLTTRYPAISHTFIAREVASIRARGFEVSTFSIRACDRGDLNSDAMRTEFASTQVLVGGGVRPILRAIGRLALRRPAALFSVLLSALRTGHRTPQARLWQVFYFVEAVVLHRAMTERGLRHVHVHHANVPADVARLACRLGNAIDGPGTWHWSLSLHGSAEFSMIHQWDIAAKVRDARAIACISDFCRAQIMPLVEEEHWAKMSVVRMGIDPARFAPRPEDAEVTHGAGAPLRLLTVGRLDPVKGFPILLNAVADLVARGRRVELRIVGKGPMESRLEAQIAALGLGGVVELVGALNEDGVIEQLQRADVFVMSSFNEGLPVVLMEAMAAGVPVITTQVGAVSELITHGVSGLIVPPTNAAALAAAVTRLHDDVALRASMAEAGRVAVNEEFVMAKTGERITAFLRAAVLTDPTGPTGSTVGSGSAGSAG